MLHVLKTVQPYFEALWSGEKRFEVRKNDRCFQVGDGLCLREYDAVAGSYSGRLVMAKVLYILVGPQFGVEAGYCVMSLGAMRQVEG